MAEGSGADEITTSSMQMDLKALRWLRQENHGRVVIVTDFMSTLHKVQKECLYADRIDIILVGLFEQIIWIFSPDHALSG